MDPFASRASLTALGFCGFQSIGELQAANCAPIPSVPGVYVLFREEFSKPKFLPISTGGRFKGRDPCVAAHLLEAAWVPRAHVVYIGKAGAPDSRVTLRSRLKQYFNFGAGKPVGHWGGRYVWHLADAQYLLVAWCMSETPRDSEKELIALFADHYGKRPFANLTG